MVRRSKNKELLKRLDEIQSKMKRKSTETVLVSVEDWLETTGTETFVEYCEKQLEFKSPGTTVIIDDFILQTDMYLDLKCIVVLSKDEVKKFIKLATSSEIDFMKNYIEAFEKLYVVRGDNRASKNSQESILKYSGSFVKDFYKHYKVLSIEQLVERYKDQSFFKKLE